MKNITIVNLIKDSFKKSSEIYQKSWKMILPVAIVYSVITYLPEFVKKTAGDNSPLLSIAGLIMFFVGFLISMGIVFIGKKLFDGKKFDFMEMFEHRDRYWSYIWLNIKVGFYILIGLILFIVPGVIMAIKYSFASYIFLLKGKDVKQSMDISAKYTSGIKMKLFGFYVAAILTSAILGVIPFFGQLVVLPIAALMHMYLFLKIDKEMGKK
jgi:uncharacterized membrane protein